jgi:hypothetical protein
MATVKRITLNLSKKSAEDVQKLCEYFGESQQDVIKRSITSFTNRVEVQCELIDKKSKP